MVQASRMSLETQLLFNVPHKEIATLLRKTIESCLSLSIVTGFATVEGLKVILPELSRRPAKLKTLIVGSGTHRAFEVMDELLNYGIPEEHLYVHLGYSRETAKGAKHRFYRYHPMLHSKIYYFEMPDNKAVAFVGSHNLTGFALFGLNGEASVRVEGDIAHPEIQKIRHHIELSKSQAVRYLPSWKEAYTWWTTQFLDGLRAKTNDQRVFEKKNTVVILTVQTPNNIPSKDDIVYFEIPTALHHIRSLGTEVHIYVFETLPSTPQIGLTSLKKAKTTLWCLVEGLEVKQGAAELNTDWFIQNRQSPILERAPCPFRPSTPADMQQVRVKVVGTVHDNFEYSFDKESSKWIPVLNRNEIVQTSPKESTFLERLNIIPKEHLEWYRVIDLLAEEDIKDNQALQNALKMLSPQSKSFIMMSLRRKKL